MKKSVLQLMIVTCFTFTVSCNNDWEQITSVPDPSAKEVMPLRPGEVNENGSPEEETSNGSRTSANGDQWHKKILYDHFTGEPYETTYFYRHETQVYENSNSNIVQGYTLLFSADTNFVHVYSPTSLAYKALPIWNPGKYANTYDWDEKNRVWIKSTAQYNYITVPSCTSDKQKPTVGDSPCTTVGGTLQCPVITSSNQCYPATLRDYRGYVKNAFSITDNCDPDLTILQTPAPGTVINTPKQLTLKFEIIDNNKNELILNLPIQFLMQN